MLTQRDRRNASGGVELFGYFPEAQSGVNGPIEDFFPACANVFREHHKRFAVP
jgi:hypothetical protein